MFVEEYLKDLRAERYRLPAAGRYVARCLGRALESARARPRALGGVLGAGVLHTLLVLGITGLLARSVDGELAASYAGASLLWLGLGLAWVTLHLGMFAGEEVPRSGLGLPNFLTLGRLLAIPAVFVFVTRGHGGLGLVAVAVGGLTDVADGIAARRLGMTTRLGRVFDPVVDILFNASVVVALAVVGLVPSWILALVLLRYGLLLFGATWLYVTRGPVTIRPTTLGKGTGLVFSMLVIGVLATSVLLPAAADRVLPLLHLAIGIVVSLTVIQVLVMGIYNTRSRGQVGDPGSLRIVVGGDPDPPRPSR